MQPAIATQARSDVPPRPRLKPWFRVAATDRALVLEHAQTALVFEGRAAKRLLPALLPLLDGTRSTAEIVAELGASTGPGVERALQLLAERGLLLDGPHPDGAGSPGAFESAGLLASLSPSSTPAAVRDALASASVEVLGAGDAAAPLVEILRESGVPGARRAAWVASGRAAPDLAVVAPARDEAPAVEDWNRRALAAAQVWLQVLPFDGRFAAVGPVYVPGETCCFECYRLRRRATSGYAEEFGAVEAAPVTAAAGPALVTAAAGIAATVALRWLAHRDQRLPGVLYAYERGGTTISEHRVYRVPRCPACSAAADVAPQLPWYKENRAAAGVAT